MHAKLKEAFPDGQHYVYERDFIPGTEKVRQIQASTTGCRVFVTEHLKQLSQIPTATLYRDELPTIANNDGKILAGNFKAGNKLARIFRGMQSWTGLKSLPPGVGSTIISETKGETLEVSARRYTECKGRTEINSTIVKKGKLYQIRKKEFFDLLPREMQKQIMEQRQGFTFLQNPSLFLLADQITRLTQEETTQYCRTFLEKLGAISPQTKEIKKAIEQINLLLSSGKELRSIKSNLLLVITALFKNSIEMNRSKLSDIINELAEGRPRLESSSSSSIDEESSSPSSPLPIAETLEPAASIARPIPIRNSAIQPMFRSKFLKIHN